MPDKTAVVIDWQLSSYSGWGVYGINLTLNWARQRKELLLTNFCVNERSIDLNPIEWRLIRPSLVASRELQNRLAAFRGKNVSINCLMLRALGNDLAGTVSDVNVSGAKNVGIVFSEETAFSAQGLERAKSYCLIVAGSSWNQAVLAEAGVASTALVLQGIDPTIFHCAPKADFFAGRFAIFSGGKLEYRKGQDLVVEAFRIFGQRHPDALLVTAWTSPWPDAARTLNAHERLAPIPFQTDGKIDVSAWLAANGIAPGQFIDLGAMPNSAMPRLYRETDVAVFPNRCEGGTNLVAMECMACGVPVILSRNTGHLDLIAPDRCFPLERQSPIAGADHLGWGESDVEEIVETLEVVRRDRAASRARAECGATFMSGMTWSNTVRQLTEVIARHK